jgi:hypothetical protein
VSVAPGGVFSSGVFGLRSGGGDFLRSFIFVVPLSDHNTIESFYQRGNTHDECVQKE